MLVYNVCQWISSACWLLEALLVGDWDLLASPFWGLVRQLGYAPVGLIIGGVLDYGYIYIYTVWLRLLIGVFACRHTVRTCYVGLVWDIDVFPL